MNRFFSTICVIILFILMLLFPQSVFEGASSGILLWFNIVLPTLLPFIIISNLLIHTRAIDWIAKIASPLMCRLFRVSPYGAFAILTGFLCGYPMGSKVTADLLRNDYLSLDEGRYLLSFCNNTSPMFIISYVIWQNLNVPELTLPFLIILMLSPVLCSFLFRRYYHLPVSYGYHNSQKNTSGTTNSSDALMDSCIMNGFETITKVGGYIMLFSIFISFAELFPIRHTLITSVLLPSLEITTGIKMICASSLSSNIRMIGVLTLTAFGGWCSVAQTRSMIQGTGLSILPYIIEKLATALVTSLLAYIYLLLF